MNPDMSLGIHPEALIPTTLVRDRFHEVRGIAGMMAGKIVVDAGSGTGYFAEGFAKVAKAIFAVDIDPTNVQLGHKVSTAPNLVFVNADLERLPFADNSVDVVFCSGVLEHLGDPLAFYSEVHRILVPGGQLIQTVDIRPKLSYWLYRVTFLFDRFYDPAHPMLHKRTVLSDDKCEEFIDPVKLRKIAEEHFIVHDEERFAGLNVNLVHVALVLTNKVRQLLGGTLSVHDSYGAHYGNLDSGLFRLYRRLLPFLRMLMHPRIMTFDALFHYMLLEKRAS